MAESVDSILNSWQSKNFQPVYFLHGEEDFYIDSIVDYAERNILSPAEIDFNLTVFYGKDSEWTAIENACKRYTMFAERQVVIVKEAQYLKDIDKLSAYISNPLSSTVLVIAYKEKKYDKRTSFFKKLSEKTVVFTSEKLKENKVEEWISNHVKAQGLKISAKGAALMHEHIGGDLSRISNEVEKLAINLKGKKNIEDDDIEMYIGISKEYNSFELQNAINQRNLAKAIRIVQYFEDNNKAGSIHSVIPVVYGTFSKVYQAYGLNSTSDAALKPLFFFSAEAVANARLIMKNYGYEGVEKTILLLNNYNLKALGVGAAYRSEDTLLREMVAKIIL